MSEATELKVAPVETHEVHELAGRELICQLRKTNMVLYGMFVELVREFYRFQTPYIIGVPDLRWDPDPQKTGIWIDSELAWNASHPEFVPAIYVKLGDVQYGSPFGEGAPAPGPMVLKDAIYSRIRTGHTTVTFVHIGGTGAEACALCDNTRAYLSDFSKAIAKDYALNKFFEVQSTPLKPHQPDSKEKWQSVSTFSVEWTEEARTKLESPILRSVDICVPEAGEELCKYKDYGIISTRQGKPDQHKGGLR